MAEPFKKSTLREYFESIVIAVILALFIRTFVVQAFKIPTGSMEENLLIGDHLLVNKFVLRSKRHRRSSAPLLPIGTDQARRRDRVQVSRGAGPRFHQARDRAAGRNGRAAGEEGLHQRHAARTSLTSTFLEPPGAGVREVQRGDVVRRPRALRSGDGAAQSVFRDGRQPRQLAGQPLLGLPAARAASRARRCVIYWSYEAGREDYQEEGAGGDRVAGSSRCSRTSSHARAGIGCSTRYADDQALLKLAVVAILANATWHLWGVYSAPLQASRTRSSRRTQFNGGKIRTARYATRILDLAVAVRCRRSPTRTSPFGAKRITRSPTDRYIASGRTLPGLPATHCTFNWSRRHLERCRDA